MSDYLLLTLLPFWKEIFSLISSLIWPLVLLIVLVKFKPQILSIFSRRDFSLKGFGAEMTFSNSNGTQPMIDATTDATLSESNLNLPATEAIVNLENMLRVEIEKIPEGNRDRVLLNALAIEKIEKDFAFTYMHIFGSQIVFLQRINERGGWIEIKDAEIFFSEVAARFPAFKEADFDKYTQYLVQRGMLVIAEGVALTSSGREFLQFVVRQGLRTDLPL